MSKRLLLSACAMLPLCLLTAGAASAGTAQAAWPSLKTQLDQDNVPAGSALAALIASNQDFQMLRPEESYDKLSVPPWLRVLWLKGHPDTQYVPGDASGGYPLVLSEVHEWMVSHPDLQPGSLGRGEAAEKRTPTGPHGTPGPDLEILGDTHYPRSESDIRINFWNPSQIVSASNSINTDGTLAIAYSGDGGATWKQTSLPRDLAEAFQSDPTVDWTSDGTAWASAISIFQLGTNDVNLYLHSYKSTDGGATWKMDNTISSPSQSAADKEMLWTDHSDQSPYKDTIHVIWHDGRAVFVSHHTPGGGWSDPLQISRGETLGTGIGADIKTDAQGNVYAFWPDTGSRRIYFAKSTNGGQSFSTPVAVSTTFQSFQTILPAQFDRGVLLYATGAVDPSGTNVYVAWTDLSGAKGCTTPFNDPQNNVSSACKTRIWLAKSTTGGAKWAKAKVINNSTSKNDQFNPWLTMDPTSGLLGIMYYDTIGLKRTSVNVYFQSSANGGTSWYPPVKVTSAPSDDSTMDDGNQYGDYNSLSGFAARFFPSWTDRRSTTVHESVWTAPILIQSKSCQESGSGSTGLKIFIESLDDLLAVGCAP
jgi:hypothetical protein